MRVVDIMTRDVISVAPDDPVHRAVRLMLQNRVSGLPVIDESGKLVGVVTEGDLLRRAEIGTEKHRPRWIEFLIGPDVLAKEYVKARGRRVEEVMTTSVETTTEDTPLDAVVDRMERHGVKRLPVVRDGKVVGIVSRRNLVRALASMSHALGGATATDASIREALHAEMDRQPWGPASSVNVIVRDGVVQLWGGVMDDTVRQALRVAAENTPGVKKVEDHLVWITPMGAY